MSAGTVSIDVQVKNDAQVKKLQQSLKGLKQETVGLNRPMDQAGKSIDGVGQSSTKVTTQVRSMGDRVQQAGSGMALAGAAAVSLWNAYDNVTDAAKKVEIAESGVARGQLTLSRARETLTKLQQSGTASALDLEQAQLAVASAEGRLERSNLLLTNSQEALNEAWLNAATSIIPSVFTGISGISQAYQALVPSVDDAVDSYLRQAAALQGSGVQLTEVTGNLAEFTVENANAASSVAEVGAAAAEGGAAFTELGTSATQGALAFVDVSGNAVQATGALTEVGTTAVQAGTSAVEMGANFGEAASDMTSLAGNVAQATGNMVEVGSAAAGAGVGALRFATAAEQAGVGALRFASEAQDAGKSALDLGNDIGTMTGAVTEAESAVVTSLVGYRQLKDLSKDAAAGLKDTSGALTTTGAAATGAAIGVKSIIGVFISLASVLLIAGAAALAVHKNFLGLGDNFEKFLGVLDQLSFALHDLGLVDLSDAVADTTEWIDTNTKSLGKWISEMLGMEDAAEGLTEEMLAQEQAVSQYDQALNGLSPLLRQAAQEWELYGNAQAATGERGQNILQYFQELDAELQRVTPLIRDLALANGMDLNQALSMTQDEMYAYIANISELGPTAEQAAEETARAAQQFADAWMTSFERIKSAQQEFAGTMQSAIQKMGQEFGEEMEVGLSDIEKNVSKGIQAFTQQFTEEIFPEDFIAAAIVEGNDPDEIAEELRDLMDDVVDEDIITKEQAKGLFEPLLKFLDHDLPRDTEQAFGYIAGRMPHLLDQITPVIVNGIQLAGGEARGALKTWLVDPFLEGLRSLETGASGIKFGRSLLTQVQSIMPQLRAQFPQIAGLMQQTFENAALTTDEKVQEIIGYLGQISPAWEEEIMNMDQDADGMADIVDDKILGPIETMKLGILEAFQAVFEAMGRTDWAENLQGEINEITGNFESMDNAITEVPPHIEDIDGSLLRMANRTQGIVNQIDENGFKVIAKSADGTKLQIQSLSEDGVTAMVDLKTGIVTNNDGSITSYDNLGAAADRAKKKIDGIMEAARQAQLDEDEAWFLKQDEAAGPEGGAPPAITAPVVPPPDINPFKQRMNELWTWLQGHWNTTIGGFQKFADDVSNALGTVNFASFRTAWAAFETWQTQNRASLLGAWNKFVADVGTVFSYINFDGFKTAWAGFEQWQTANRANLIMGWNKFTQDVGAVLGMINFESFKTAFTGARTWLDQNFINPVKGAIEAFVGWVNTTIGGIDLGEVGEFFSGIFSFQPVGAEEDPTAGLTESIRKSVELASLQLDALADYVSGTVDNINNIFKRLDFGLLLHTTNAARINFQYTFDIIRGIAALGALNINTELQKVDFNLLVASADTARTAIVTAWSEMRNGIASNINGIVQVMANMAREYVALGKGVQQVVVNSVVTSWSASRNGISSNINGIVQSMANLAREYVALRNGVIQVLSTGNNAWRQHSGILAQAASSGSSSVSRLSNAVRSNMSSIVSAMNNATSAANRLRSAINSLQSKTITVTTRYRTVGSPASSRTGGTRRAATGFSGIVDQPTRIFAGESNRPELVQVTPLSAAGGRLSMNKSAAMSGMAISKNNGVFTTPTIRAGGSSGKRADRVVIMPDGTMVTYLANGNIKHSTVKFPFNATKGIKAKGIKGTIATKKGGKATSEFHATGVERATDPLMRTPRHGGVVGRGGKSLFDLGIASSRVGGRYVVDEKRFEDGSVRRLYNDGSVEFGRDIYRLNTKYLKGKLKSGKSVKEVKYYANGKAEVTYYGEDKPHKMKHDHPGPFDQGSGKKKKDRYTTIAAAKGWRGFVNEPTQFLAGERGREYVDIQPIKDWANNMATNARSMAGKYGGGAGGRPVIIELHVKSELDGKVISESIRKELLGGIYSMT